MFGYCYYGKAVATAIILMCLIQHFTIQSNRWCNNNSRHKQLNTKRCQAQHSNQSQQLINTDAALPAPWMNTAFENTSSWKKLDHWGHCWTMFLQNKLLVTVFIQYSHLSHFIFVLPATLLLEFKHIKYIQYIVVQCYLLMSWVCLVILNWTAIEKGLAEEQVGGCIWLLKCRWMGMILCWCAFELEWMNLTYFLLC